MLAIAATISATHDADNYSNSRRRNNSRLIAEISSSAVSAAAVNSTLLRTRSVSDEGTYTSRDSDVPLPTVKYTYGPCSSP